MNYDVEDSDANYLAGWLADLTEPAPATAVSVAMQRLPVTRDEMITISCALCRSVLTYMDDGFPTLAADARIVRDKVMAIVDWMVEQDIEEIYIV